MVAVSVLVGVNVQVGLLVAVNTPSVGVMVAVTGVMVGVRVGAFGLGANCTAIQPRQ